MPVHEVCKGCIWNQYPICEGIKMFDGNYMNIENQSPSFQCGQKYKTILVDLSIITKSEQELKMEDLEERIKVLEGV